jgi:hypothetical protein
LSYFREKTYAFLKKAGLYSENIVKVSVAEILILLIELYSSWFRTIKFSYRYYKKKVIETDNGRNINNNNNNNKEVYLAREFKAEHELFDWYKIADSKDYYNAEAEEEVENDDTGGESHKREYDYEKKYNRLGKTFLGSDGFSLAAPFDEKNNKLYQPYIGISDLKKKPFNVLKALIINNAIKSNLRGEPKIVFSHHRIDVLNEMSFDKEKWNKEIKLVDVNSKKPSVVKIIRTYASDVRSFLESNGHPGVLPECKKNQTNTLPEMIMPYILTPQRDNDFDIWICDVDQLWNAKWARPIFSNSMWGEATNNKETLK